MALGAQPGQVVRLIMRSGLELVAIGLALGLVAAAGAGRASIQTLLFDVRPLEPLDLRRRRGRFRARRRARLPAAVVARVADRSASGAARGLIRK